MNANEPIFLFLQQKIGLDAASIGVKAVEAAIHETMRETGFSRPEDFLTALQDHASVMTALIEKLVVPETWFFRDQIPFDVLSSLAKSRAGNGEIIRIVSMPCSTGEEPYSIAITMLEAGFAPGSFAVDAIDLSHVSLERARQGFYGPISFRGAKPGFREKYFLPSGKGFQIRDEIKRCVQFHHGNLLDPFLLKGREGYEVLFCRNVLIYLDEVGRTTALNSFKRLLLPGGLLFVGHAETLQIFNRNFRLLPEASSFGYVYLGETEARPVEGKKISQQARPTLRSTSTAAPGKRTGPVHRAAAAGGITKLQAPIVVAKADHDTTEELKVIAELADRGLLDEAMQKCELFLQRARTVAQGHYLMGVIREAKQLHTGAEDSLRRALYLDPRHQEALVHLSLLLERKGDFPGAKLVRERAERIGKEKVPA